MRITLKDVEENVRPLGGKLSYDKGFIFELLAAYGRSQGNITRLRNGQLNVADDKDNEIAQKGVVYFKPADVSDDELYTIVDDLKTSPTVIRYSTRFVIATNYQKLLAIDTKTGEPLDIAIREIDRHYTYFLPWAGMEKSQFIAENHADVKAAEKMAKLFDTLVAYNGYKTADDWHNLTTFFTRLLFCFFAEDTGIFKKNQFIDAIASYTQEDGQDLKEFLKVLFASLDDEDRDGYPAYLAEFPYVNGRLFSDFTEIPKFNKVARDLLIESSSKLDWSNINPDIFGSMFQAVVRPGERTGLGQHYTSVPNIMKAIEPLFLDQLKEGFDKAYDDAKKLEQLLGRISKIKVFDPACGSGNFLIIAYKELRKLEHAILERQGELAGHTQRVLFGSRIDIEKFYGIEIDDFAHEVAVLSLWLAKHQMNMEFAEKFGIELPLIPLKEAGNIVHGNAARTNWNDVCPNNGMDEIYIIGNPPYGGARKQNSIQKSDMVHVFDKYLDKYKDLDYIAIWFFLGASYIKDSDAQVAFVTTNSITQGEQVSLLWPHIFSNDIEIGFAYHSFNWANNAKSNAGVTVAIINLRNKSSAPKHLFLNNRVVSVTNINGYLQEGRPDLFVHRRQVSISSLPKMDKGNMPLDGGNLLLTPTEKDSLLEQSPNSSVLLKRIYGSEEYINDVERWCLWIPNEHKDLAFSIPGIAKRINKVRTLRLGSKDKGAQKKAVTAHQFREMRSFKKHAIIVPSVSSGRREYVVAGIIDTRATVSNLAFALYDVDIFVLGLIISRIHMVWVRTVAGRLRTDYRYSSAIVYNNFPLPPLREDEKKEIEEKALAVLDARESHPEKTLRDMYNPDKMPDNLRTAHQELDEVVDKVYRKKPFENDEERLAYLFDLYETMITHKKERIL